MRFNHPRVNKYLLEEYGITYKTAGTPLLKEAIDSIENLSAARRELKQLNARRFHNKLSTIIFNFGHRLYTEKRFNKGSYIDIQQVNNRFFSCFKNRFSLKDY